MPKRLTSTPFVPMAAPPLTGYALSPPSPAPSMTAAPRVGAFGLSGPPLVLFQQVLSGGTAMTEARRRVTRQTQPRAETKDTSAKRQEEHRAQEAPVDPVDPNRSNCAGPYRKVTRYTRAEFMALSDPITESTPIS